MILALDYMTRTDSLDPAIAERANRYIAQGYNRLLTFESKEDRGGFSLWSGGRPSLFLSAYALMQFTDMTRVHTVARRLTERIAGFVERHAQPDGSYAVGTLSHQWGSWKKTPYYTSAYVAWALAHAGRAPAKALEYVRTHAAEVEDPYGIALGAMALLTADPNSPDGQSLVKRLLALRNDEGTWAPTGETFIGGRGRTGEIEATALAALVLAKSGSHSAVLDEVLDQLRAWRGSDGRFGSTHSTVLALKALLAAQDNAVPAESHVSIRTGTSTRQVVLPAGATERVRVSLGTLDPNVVHATLHSEGRVRAMLTRTTFEPWAETSLPQGRLALDVSWPDAPMESGGTYTATVQVRNQSSKPAKVVTLAIGLPPGITIEPEDVAGPGLEEAERATRTMVLYLENMEAGAVRSFTLPFRVRYAFAAKTAPSRAYEYYVEHEQTVLPPVSLVAK